MDKRDLIQDAAAVLLALLQKYKDDPSVCREIDPFIWLWVRALGNTKDCNQTQWRRYGYTRRVLDPCGGSSEERPKPIDPPDTRFSGISRVELDDAIASLTGKQQKMIRHVYFDGMQQQEIADLYGITQAGVSRTLAKGMSELKKRLS